MEEVFLYADQIEPPETSSMTSNYEDMISAIILWVPDNRLLPDNYDE